MACAEIMLCSINMAKTVLSNNILNNTVTYKSQTNIQDLWVFMVGLVYHFTDNVALAGSLSSPTSIYNAKSKVEFEIARE